jgi:HrpA-like RNA helicase
VNLCIAIYLYFLQNNINIIMSEYDNIGILDPNGKNVNPLNNEPYSDEYKNIAKIWSNFPAYELRSQILDTITKNQVTLVISGTGSGKTVLLPKYLLHVFKYAGKIGITLPKQIIAKSSAEFAAKTLDVKLGEHVGYQYKGSDSKGKSKDTQLLYATDGTIVGKLMNDPMLSEFDGIIIDEAHERKVQIDFLLYLLKKTIIARPEFKLVIMSATINESIFEEYFKDNSFGKVNVGAKTNYEITSHFLSEPVGENMVIDKGFEILKNIIESEKDKKDKGDILFFVTSTKEADDICKRVNLEKLDGFCIEVYSGMNEKKQEMAQDRELYKSQTDKSRKIVIATNVAESSLTIDGIKYVIDSGLELAGYFDPEKRAKVLVKRLITHAQAKQRMGRTGRTEPGTCYHLYTQEDFDNKMERFPEPAIRTNNIYDECLKLLMLPDIKSVKNLKNMLNEMIEPPTKKYVDTALKMLKELNLVNKEITPLGEAISELRTDPMIGIALIYGKLYSCSQELCAVFAMIDASKGNTNELFTQPNSIYSKDKEHLKKITEKFNNARKKIANSYGDHLTFYEIFEKYHNMRKQYQDSEKRNEKINEFCHKYFIKRVVLDKAEKYYKKMKSIVRSTHFDFEKLDLVREEEISESKLKDKIMYCISKGFLFSSGKLNKNGGYDNDQNEEMKINKSSFITLKKKSPELVIYDSLFMNKTMKSGTDMIFVSVMKK